MSNPHHHHMKHHHHQQQQPGAGGSQPGKLVDTQLVQQPGPVAVPQGQPMAMPAPPLPPLSVQGPPPMVAPGQPTQPYQPSQPYAGSAAQVHINFDPSGKYKVKFEGTFAAVEAAISANDGVKSQHGVMVTMSDNVNIHTRLEGGIGSSLCRCCCAGGSFFLSHYHLRHGHGHRGDVLLAPAVPGDIIMLPLDGRNGWMMHHHGFLACDESVSIGVQMLNLAQGCCGGDGLFVMEATGAGRLLACSYGAITRYDLAPGEVRKIDHGYCVAWSSGMEWNISLSTRSVARSIMSGHLLVCRFKGPGTVFVQTRSLLHLARALAPYMPNNNGGGGNDQPAITIN